MKSRGLLNLPSLFIAVDLNFILSSLEVWGVAAKCDPLTDYFSNLLVEYGLVDIVPNTLGPTWRNGCGGSTGINNRTGPCLLAEQLVQNLPFHWTWTRYDLMSYHFPICFEWIEARRRNFTPFCFNDTWLKESVFVHFVKSLW